MPAGGFARLPRATVVAVVLLGLASAYSLFWGFHPFTTNRMIVGFVAGGGLGGLAFMLYRRVAQARVAATMIGYAAVIGGIMQVVKAPIRAVMLVSFGVILIGALTPPGPIRNWLQRARDRRRPSA